MALEDTVIVTEGQLAGLYAKKGSHRHYSVLEDEHLLPLTVKSLTTESGQALLHLATWVYFSGYISAKRTKTDRKFASGINGKKKRLDYLLETYLTKLSQKLKYKGNTEDAGVIILNQDRGAFGRLMHAMGIPITPLGSTGIIRKPAYDDKLPDYFWGIVKAVPADDHERNQKRDLIYTIGRILFKDRLKTGNSKDANKKPVYLQLNSHETEESARKYGRSVVDFLNKVIEMQRQPFPSFEYSQIKTGHYQGLHACKLIFNEGQIGYLITNFPSILGFQVKY